mmetsp:Transcript_47173/g.131228  ORF Transcript_47173/g.131228 Transcript_47173/m.131228 type:complete len:92 (-) Transcript_47173:43-318(-)
MTATVVYARRASAPDQRERAVLESSVSLTPRMPAERVINHGSNSVNRTTGAATAVRVRTVGKRHELSEDNRHVVVSRSSPPKLGQTEYRSG